MKKFRRSVRLIALAVCCTLAVSLLAGCTGGSTCQHDWMEATCTQPRICRICGKTAGEPLGHTWIPADCEHARTCSVCGTTEGGPLGHDWDGNGTCRRCGQSGGDTAYVEEEPAQQPVNDGSYLEFPDCHWSDVAISRGGTMGHPLIFDEPVRNCRQVTAHFQYTEIDYGDLYGRITIFVQTTNGKWVDIGEMNIDDMEEHTKTFYFDEPMTFQGMFVAIPDQQYGYSYSAMYYMTDFYF